MGSRGKLIQVARIFATTKLGRITQVVANEQNADTISACQAVTMLAMITVTLMYRATTSSSRLKAHTACLEALDLTLNSLRNLFDKVRGAGLNIPNTYKINSYAFPLLEGSATSSL
jgi:hypothetical protein